MRTTRMFLVATALLCCVDPAAHADRDRDEVKLRISGATSDELPNHLALALLKGIEFYKTKLVKLEAMSAQWRGNESDVDARHNALVERCKERIEKLERDLAKQKRKQQTDWHLRGLPGER